MSEKKGDRQDMPPPGIVLAPRAQGGTGIASVSIAWGFGVMNILNGMADELSPEQYKLAFKVFDRWSATVPLSLLALGGPHFILPGRVRDIVELLENTQTTATLVRIVRTVLPHRAENRERDERIIADARAFCEEHADIIRQLEDTGFSMEDGLPKALEYHCSQLMLVALGDEVYGRFMRELEALQNNLKEQIRLNEQKPN